MITINIELPEGAQAETFVTGLIADLAAIKSVTVNVTHVERACNETTYSSGYCDGYEAACKEAARVVAGMKVYATSDEDDSANDVLARAVAVLGSLKGFTPPAPPKPIDDDDQEMDDFWLGLTGDDEDTGAITVWESIDQIVASDENAARHA